MYQVESIDLAIIQWYGDCRVQILDIPNSRIFGRNVKKNAGMPKAMAIQYQKRLHLMCDMGKIERGETKH